LQKTPSVSAEPAPVPQPSIAPSPSQTFDARNAPLPLIAIFPGSFLMGSDKGFSSEKPAHKVTLTHAFLIGATEITQKQWTATMGNNPSCFKGDDLPVECVPWDDAVEFCRKLTEAEREKGNLPEGMAYRLPTEAEWEYCCRAGTATEYCFGNDAILLGDYAWFDGNSNNRTHPVGTKKANAWGICDMHGNVYEWCQDWYADKYSGVDQADPVGPATGDMRVLRGGSWDSNAQLCRSAFRYWFYPDYRNCDFGFRVVVTQMREAEKREEAPKTEEERKKEAMRDQMENAPFPLIAISPGTFMMGSDKGSDDEKPAHKVTLTHAFLMGATEVTQAQYRSVTNASPSSFKGDDLPVEQVSRNDAMEFCRKLTAAERKKGNLPAGMEYRLPTEAEWEYCCRAGSTTTYCFGDDEGPLGDYAWFDKNAKSTTHPVGIKKPNAWGLYDMHGNVWEWCHDWYADKYQAGSQTDPVGPATGDSQMMRGGSWLNDEGYCRSANRLRGTLVSRLTPDVRNYYAIGFRVVVGEPLTQK
ncbi:MAG: formylglycine-generating enzyme family protein, partial [Candidatus Brocadiia bacterium]